MKWDLIAEKGAAGLKAAGVEEVTHQKRSRGPPLQETEQLFEVRSRYSLKWASGTLGEQISTLKPCLGEVSMEAAEENLH
ncbi:hypothetical protein GCM10009870_110 [Leucobacter celer subsp. celer]